MSVPYFLLLLATELVMEARGQNYCYSTDPDPYDFHAEFSGYFPVQNENSDPITFDGEWRQFSLLQSMSSYAKISVANCHIP